MRKRKNPIDNLLTTLIARGLKSGGISDLATLLVYLKQGYDCKDCGREYVDCECEWCDECCCQICMCKYYTKENANDIIRLEILKLIKKLELTSKDLEKIKYELMLRFKSKVLKPFKSKSFTEKSLMEQLDNLDI